MTVKIPFVEPRPGEVPHLRGVYLVWTDHQFLQNHTERVMVFWDGERFSYPLSDQRFRNHVYAWLGPLPVLKLTDTEKPVF